MPTLGSVVPFGEPSSAIALGIAALIYGRGVWSAWRHAGTGRAVQRWQVLSFAGGLVTVAIALLSPIDALAEELFSAHMVQHVLLSVVAPPLLVAGLPVVAALWNLPARQRRAISLWALRTPLRAAWDAITTPLVAVALHAIALWSWHTPALYTSAIVHPAVHALEHASFVFTACLVWWPILSPAASPRSAYAAGMLSLFATMMQSGALGALLTLAHSPWFPIHAAGAREWGMSPLEDQQLAGLIMWVPAAFLYLAATGALFLRWMRALEARDPGLSAFAAVRAQSRRTDAAVG